VWYAVQNASGKEKMISRQLEGEFFGLDGEWRELFCVKKKRYQGMWHDERERFLPGYVFFVTRIPYMGNQIPTLENTDPLKCCMISGQIDEFRPITHEEEQFLIKITGGKDEVDMSYGVICENVLSIYEGPLTGMESRVRKIDRHKRKGLISMNLCGKENLVEVGLEITKKTYKTYAYPNILNGSGKAAGCGT